MMRNDRVGKVFGRKQNNTINNNVVTSCTPKDCKNELKVKLLKKQVFYRKKYCIQKSIIILTLLIKVSAGAHPLQSVMERAKADARGWMRQELRHTRSIEENFQGSKLPIEQRDQWRRPPTTEEGIEAEKKIQQETNPLYKGLSESKAKRPPYLNLELEYKEALNQDPQEVLKAHYRGCRYEPVYRTKQNLTVRDCREGRPETRHTCHRYLKEAEIVEKGKFFDHTYIEHFEHWVWNRWKDSRKLPEERRTWYMSCGNACYHNQTHVYVYKKRTVSIDTQTGEKKEGPWEPISKEEYDLVEPVTMEKDIHVKDVWVSDCSVLEERAKVGLCRKVDSNCLSKGKVLEVPEGSMPEGETSESTRVNKIERECFQEEDTYVCGGSSIDTCKPFKEQGCYQIKSQCVEELEGECTLFKTTLECQTDTKEETEQKQLICGGNTPYCLDGSCGTTEFEPNKDMMEVLTKLKTFSEVAKHSEGDPLRIFKGRCLRCSKNIIGFRDCCKGGGWGMSLAGCGEEDKTLQHQRSKGLCVEVGTYCAHKEKLTKMCLTKKTSFCCFANKLLKAIQEQGRAQLGIGWGDGKHPDCRGLTPEELSRIDFSRLDLRAAVEEVTMNKAQIQNTLKDRMTTLTADLRGNLASNKKLIEASHPKIPDIHSSHLRRCAAGETGK